MTKNGAPIVAFLMGSLLLWNSCTISNLFNNEPVPKPQENSSTPAPVQQVPKLDNPIVKPVVEQEPLPEIDENAIEGTGSNKKIGFGVLMTSDESQPGIPQEWLNIFHQYEGYYLVPNQEKKVYLTFDLGYESGFTVSLLDTLKAMQVPATFFLLGQYIEKNPEIVKRIALEGYAVGNHSYYHESLPSLTEQEIIRDTQKCLTLYHQVTNRKMHLYRPPMGEFSEYSLSVLHELGYKSIFWSIAYKDWEALPGGEQESYDTVMKYIHPGAIVLMHVVTDDNVLALPKIVQSLTEKGYRFASLDEL